MAKVKNPITLSREFGIDQRALSQCGVLDVTLAIDTRLFIDPLVFKFSCHAELNTNGVQLYESHFGTIIKLLTHSRAKDDPAWKAARSKLEFPEIKGTCLGYGAGSIKGRGCGISLTNRIVTVAAQIVEIGIRDPDLFTALALFESDIGPDRISDMATNIIIEPLSAFNTRVLRELGLKGEKFPTGQFLVNPYEQTRTPIILVPTDILRDLPVAEDWYGIAEAASKNEELRKKVNEHIASIWLKKTKQTAERLKSEALKTKEAFETLLKAIKSSSAEPYDTATDPKGLTKWATASEAYTHAFPLHLGTLSTQNLDDVFVVVKKIVAQFRFLIESKGLNKELYRSTNLPRHESTAQRLFFAVAYSYCRAEDIDISPEIDTGTGKIDFKFSRGFKERVLVEIKLSTNPKAVSGYKTQLEVYKASEETLRATYVVIDVGGMGNKLSDLTSLRNDALRRREPLSDLEFVDGQIKPTASKR